MFKNNYVFLHIPKTAGLTVSSAFQNISENNPNINFYRSGAKGMVANFSTEYFKNLDLEINKNILGGHFVFSNRCKEFKLFSIVRETVDLFISNLYFHYKENFLNNKLNTDCFAIIEKNLKIDLNFIEKDLLTISKLLENNYLVSNIITKTLAGIPFEKFFYVLKDYKINNQDYLKAVDNLQYFSYIGNSQNTEKFIKIFLNHLQVNSVNYKNINIFKKDKLLIDQIKSGLKQEINAYNYYDTKLLKIIKEKFK